MSSVSGDGRDFYVGQRVIINEADVATVKYVGEIEGTKAGQIWVGVDFDNDDRGKHDGTHNGKRYFQARKPTSGAFIKQAKVSKGLTFMEALRDKYGLMENASGDKATIEDIQRSLKAACFELVGFDKVNRAQAEFTNLRVVGLLESKIYGLGDEERDISKVIPRTQELDLSGNLIDDWEEVDNICSQLPRLKSFESTVNVMKLPRNLEAHAMAFKNVERLTLVQMGLTWPDVVLLTKDMPKIKFLCVINNNISDIPELDKELFPTLQRLEINLNPLKSWALVERFARLPSLTLLNLAGCELQVIEEPSDPEQPYFPALTTLYLGWNLLDSWQSVANLRHVANLTDVRIRNNPILETANGETCRQMFIASIPSLKVYNGAELERTERYGAELDYLKKFAKDYMNMQQMEEGAEKEASVKAFHQRHPFYEKFVKCFGPPDETDIREVKLDIKSSLVSINIECPMWGTEFKVVQKKLPPTMTIQKLIPFLKRVVKAPKGVELSLSCHSADAPDIEIQLNNSLRDLFFYNLNNGDYIVVKWDT